MGQIRAMDQIKGRVSNSSLRGKRNALLFAKIKNQPAATMTNIDMPHRTRAERPE